MNEKVYKTMAVTGAGNIALGVIMLVSGIACGIVEKPRFDRNRPFPGCGNDGCRVYRRKYADSLSGTACRKNDGSTRGIL